MKGKANEINVFPTGGDRKEYSRWEVTGNVVVPAIKPTKNGYVMRVYNPMEDAQTVEIKMNGQIEKGVIPKRGVGTVLFKGNKAQTETRKIMI